MGLHAQRPSTAFVTHNDHLAGVVTRHSLMTSPLYEQIGS